MFEQLYERGLKLITRYRKKRMRPRADERRKGTRTKQMNNRLVPLVDRILLRKRAIIESVNDQLKNICQVQHTRHRSIPNFMVNLLGGLIAYTYHLIKPSLDLEDKGLPALPPVIF